MGRGYYLRSQMGQLTLHTDGASLNAEVLDEHEDRVLQSFTAPNDEPVLLAQGTYRVRLSAPGQLSETSLVTIHRVRDHQCDVNLKRRQLWQPIKLGENDHSDLIDLGRNHDVILQEWRFGKASLRRLHGATANQIWELALDAHTPPAELESEDDREVWSDLCDHWATAELRQRPLLLRPAPDVDGDGTGDLIWTWPSHTVSILALFGASGKFLWWRRTRGQTRITSSPLATDVNSDGRPDIVATFWTRNGETWAEAFSGNDGASLWRQELNAFNCWYTRDNGN